MRKRIISIMLVICMVLSLAPITANAMSIYVDLSVTGAANLTIEVESGDNIGNVKGKIKAATGYSETIQILKYNGRVLQNGRTLSGYNIQKDSIIELSFAPSVSSYATKAQLMDGTFAPDSNGNADYIGKLVFGKDSRGNALQWYILGKDTGVTGDNTIIFAASPIVTNQKFKTFSEEVSYRNYYGESELRDALQNMATNANYFTSAEQKMMNDTTVTTKDTNSGADYTTTDKLYALTADTYEVKTIKAGSSNQKVLAMSKYWGSQEISDGFWLRSPHDSNAHFALRAIPGLKVYFLDLFQFIDVRPASNLNLSSELFASAATAASSSAATYGTIKRDTNTGEPKAMTLRLDGSSKNIGAALYNTTTGDIKVTKGSATGNVALVVQGNDGTNDWYYSKQITGDKTVNASTIKSALGISTGIDLSTCKIWLETTDANGMIYAVNAEKEIEPINTTYATKEQLMNSFSPYSNGTAVNIGKLVFGKNSSRNPQEWYILGEDDGVTNDNTVIFAASPIETERVFESKYENDKTDTSLWSDCDYNGVSITQVYPNHYGASDLRNVLQTMAMNTDYFTSAEQDLMNPTTVTVVRHFR